MSNASRIPGGRFKAASLAIVALLISHCLMAAEQEVVFRGQRILYEGAELKWIGDPSVDGELLFIYKDTTGINTFTPSVKVEARILAVGGGGAGGTVRSNLYTTHPGGGGGGAGEFVERSSVCFAAGSKAVITVGAGGMAQSGCAPGFNGADSAIVVGNEDVLRVKGGGGGGGESAGSSGGSGGGGSNAGAAGGAPQANETDGAVHAGGSSEQRYAGGGGGAGAEGGMATTLSGDGGVGRQSDIDMTQRYYAGGGGGGSTASANGGCGGLGGGGYGGGWQNQISQAPTAGVPNTGSGGGGGGLYYPGADGGSGIVIIRLSGFCVEGEPSVLPDGGPYKETRDGVEWTFVVKDGMATVGGTWPTSSIPVTVSGPVTIPSVLGGCRVVDIGKGAFFNCSQIESVEIPLSVTNVDYAAFRSCSELRSIRLPEGVRELGDYAFYGCDALSEVLLPDSLGRLGAYVFMYCDALTSIFLPSGVSRVGTMMFNDSRNLTNVCVAAENSCFSSHGGALYDKSGARLVECPHGLERLELPDTLCVIGDWSCEGQPRLESLTIPAGVTNIGVGAFRSCSGLKTINFLGNAPVVKKFAFDELPSECVIRVAKGSAGWGVDIPGMWNGLPIKYDSSHLVSEDFSGVPTPIAVDDRWNENFCLATGVQEVDSLYAIENPFFSGVVTPHGWTAANGMWVSRRYRLVGMNADLALQMAGAGQGFMHSNFDSPPQGLESVSFCARLAQQMDLASFCCFTGGCFGVPSPLLTNHTFAVACAMQDEGASAFDGAGGLSVVARYSEAGCYEARVERSDVNVLRVGLYRWSRDGSSVCLGDTKIANAYAGRFDGSSNKLGALFISCENTSLGSVRIVVGVSSASQVMNASLSTAKSYYLIGYDDTSDERLCFGTFGLGSKSCPAVFVYPVISSLPVTWPGVLKTDTFSFCTPRSIALPDAQGILKTPDDFGLWAVPDSRLSVSDIGSDAGILMLYGLRAHVPEQTLLVRAVPKSGAEALVVTNRLHGFAESAYKSLFYSLEASDVQITVGQGTADVVLDDISCRQWSAQSYDDSLLSLDANWGSPTNFVYTKVWKNGTEGLDFVPMRSDGTCPVGIRSPLADGLNARSEGIASFEFVYTNADAHARLFVQVMRECPLSGLSAATKSTEDWLTVRMIDFSLMTEAERRGGTIQIDLGDESGCSLVRVVLDPLLADESRDLACNAFFDARYGSVTIEEVSVETGGGRAVPETLEKEVDGIVWTYMIRDGVAIVGGGSNRIPAIDTNTVGKVVIPAAIDGHPVTCIANGAFSKCGLVTQLTIPPTVTNIDKWAFSLCESLESLVIPSGVTAIPGSAFNSCVSLRSVVIPEGVMRIGNDAFHFCTNLVEVTLPSTLTEIGRDAFFLCESLSSVVIPGNVHEIPYRAFYGCSHMASVTLPPGLAKIGDYAFDACGTSCTFLFHGPPPECHNPKFPKGSTGACRLQDAEAWRAAVDADATWYGVAMSIGNLSDVPVTLYGGIYEIFQSDGTIGAAPATRPETDPEKITVDNPIRLGESVYVTVRFAAIEPGGIYLLNHVGLGASELDALLRPLQLGVIVSGELRWATLSGYGRTSENSDFYDLVFRYDVKPGDLALPLRLAIEDGQYRVNNADVWRWTYVNDGQMRVLWAWMIGSAFWHQGIDPSWGERLLDYTLERAGLYVETVDFDSNWQSMDVWRSVHAGSSVVDGSQPSIVLDGVADQAKTYYIWSTDESAVQIYGETTLVEMGSQLVHVGRIVIPAGASSAAFGLRGVTAGSSADIVLSASPQYRYDEATGERIVDYLTVPVRCIEALPPTVSILGLAGTSCREGDQVQGEIVVSKPASKNLYAYLRPLNESASNTVLCAASIANGTAAQGILVPMGQTQGAYPFYAAVLDGYGQANLFDVVLCTTSQYDASKVFPGYQSDVWSFVAENVEPSVKSVSIDGFTVGSGMVLAKPIPAGVAHELAVSVIEPSDADLTSGTTMLRIVITEADGSERTQYVPVNNVSNRFLAKMKFSATGRASVSVSAKDKDMADYGEPFIFYVDVTDPPSVSLEMDEDVWRESDSGRTVGVVLSEPAATALSVLLTLEDMGSFALVEFSESASCTRDDMGRYHVRIPAGVVRQTLRVAELDGTQDGCVHIFACVETETESPYGVAWKDYYEPSEAEVMIENDPPVLSVYPGPSTNAIIVCAGDELEVRYRVTDVPSDLSAGIAVDIFMNAGLVQRVNVTNDSERIAQLTFPCSGLGEVRITAKDQDGGVSSEPLFFQVVDPSPDRDDIGSVVNEDGTLKLTQYTGDPVTHLEIPESIGGRTVAVIGTEFANGTKFPYPGEAASVIAPMSVVTVPATVKCIEERAFGSCDGRKYGDEKRINRESFAVNGIRFLGDVPFFGDGYGTEWQREWDGDAEQIWNDTRRAPFSLLAKIFVKREYAENWAAFLAKFDMEIAGYIGEDSDCNGVICHTVVGDWAWTYMITNGAAVLSRWTARTGTMTYPEQDDGGAVFVSGGKLCYPCVTSVSGKRIEGDVRIPDKFDMSDRYGSWRLSYNVGGIGDSAFSRLAIDHVRMGGNIVRIGKAAFAGCRALFSVEHLYGVREVGDYAFAGCRTLGWIGDFGLLERLGRAAFANCTALFSASLQTPVRDIPDLAFANCTTLENIAIPEAERIGASAFAGCTALKSVRLPESLGRIDEGAFAQCLGLESIEIPESVTNVGSRAFTQCEKLAQVSVLGASVEVGDFAFAECPALEKVSFADNASSLVISDAAFSDCGSLKMVRFPKGLSRLGDCAFADCLALADVYYEGSCPKPEGERGVYDGANPYLISFVHELEGSGFPTTDWQNRPIASWTDYPNAVAHRVVVFDVGGFGERTGGGELLQRVTAKSEIQEPTVTATSGAQLLGWELDPSALHSALKMRARYQDAEGCELADYYVRADGDDNWDGRSRESAFRTINKAIETAADGSLILVGPGEYPPVSSSFDRHLVIRSEEGASQTVISGGGETRCACFLWDPMNDSHVDPNSKLKLSGFVMKGFTFRDGYAVDGYDDGCGAGVYGGTYVDCVISSCVVRGDAESSCAAAVAAKLFNCLIVNNRVEGEVAVLAGGALDCELMGCTVAGNTTPQIAFCTTNACAIGGESYETPVLTLTPLSDSVAENATAGMRVRLSRTGLTGCPTVVSLRASSSLVSVPSQVEIPVGSSSTIFTVVPVDNASVDGDRNVRIEASSLGSEACACEVLIIDDEIPSLTMSVSADTISEGGDKITVTITRDLITDKPLTVYLTGLTANRCTCPSSVEIPAGKGSVTFEIAAVDDDVARIAAEMTLRASAAGYTSVAKKFTVEDDDVPGVTLTIAPEEAQEGGSVRAILERIDKKDLSKAITVKLTASEPDEIASMPSSVVIPAGIVSRDFNIYLADDEEDNGDRLISLTGAILIESCGCSGQPSSGDAIAAELWIVDNDGPSLSLTIAPTVLKEGASGMLTVSRNSSYDKALVVGLSTDRPEEIDLPASVTIPANTRAISVSVRAIDDGVEDGNQFVSIYADDPEGSFAPDSKPLIVTDQNLPDLAMSQCDGHGPVEANAAFDWSFSVANTGFAECGIPIPYAVYLVPGQAGDASKGMKVATGTIPGGLAKDAEADVSLHLSAPSSVGTYRLAVVIDPDGAVTELDKANNTGWSDWLSVGPAFSAKVSVDGDLFDRGETITIAGATSANADASVANVEVEVYVICDGVRTTLRTKTGADGAFAVEYKPTSGVCGHCIVGACYPGEELAVEQDSFDILGMKAGSTSPLVWDVALGDSEAKTLTIRNPTGLALTGLAIKDGTLPKGCELVLVAPTTLEAGGSAAIEITATGVDLTVGVDYEAFEITLTTAEGAELTRKAYFHCQSQQAYLRTKPTSVDTTMTVGKTRMVEVAISNDGKGDSGPISANVDPCPAWLRILGGTIKNLAPGETATVTLELSPTAAHGLNLNARYDGSIGFSCVNGRGVDLPVAFTPVTEEFGGVRVDAIDDNTYHLADKPHLANAVVTVKNPYTGKVVVSGRTNPNGLWTAEGLPEGMYQLIVTAENHDEWADELLIEPGRTNKVITFLQYQSIRVSWDVKKVEITDEYDVELTLVYETNVPQPTILTHVEKELPVLKEGEQRVFTITLENVGLIAAKKVTLSMPTIDGYTFTLADNDVRVPAKSTVEIPVLFSRPATRKLMKSAALKATTVIEETVPCRPQMVTTTYWDCGVERHYSYPTEFTHDTGKCKRVTYVIEPSDPVESVPTRGGAPGGGGIGGGIGGGTGTTWKKTNCKPCVASLAEALGECGFNEEQSGVYLKLYELSLNKCLINKRFWYAKGVTEVPWFGSDNLFGALPAAQRAVYVELAKLSRDVYKDAVPDMPAGYSMLSKKDAEELVGSGFFVEENGIVESTSLDSFQAGFYVRETDGALILAFRGSETGGTVWDKIDDWIITDLGQIACRNTAQYFDAARLLSDVLERTNKHVTVIGHSLGGGLAQYALLKNSGSQRISGATFNSAGLCVRTPNLFYMNDDLPRLSQNVINIRDDGDPVSFVGRHIGPIFDVQNNRSGFEPHKLVPLIEDMITESSHAKENDWQFRKKIFFFLIDSFGTNWKYFDKSAIGCLRGMSVCPSSEPLADMDDIADAMEDGSYVPVDHETGTPSLDNRLKDLEVVTVAVQAVSEVFDEIMCHMPWERMACDEVLELLREMVEASEGGAVEADSLNCPEGMSTKELSAFVDIWNTTLQDGEAGVFGGDGHIDLPRIERLLKVIGHCHQYFKDKENHDPDEEDETVDFDLGEILRGIIVDIRDIVDGDSSSVCASVSLQIHQTVAMTRTAFDGTLTLYNGHSSVPITDVKFEPSVLDEEGFERKDLFKLLVNDEEILGANGSKLIVGADIAAGNSGSTVVRFVPTHEAAPSVAKIYRFGGTVTYTDPFTGKTATVELTPVSLTVEPSPYLKLDYFVQRDVFSDDPDTDEIEPSVPAEIAVLVRNQGSGAANNVTIDSAQPVMIDNEKGLAIDFKLSDFDLAGSSVDGKSANLGLLSTVDLGMIPAGESKVAQWWLTSSLQGHFVDMKATCTPRNKWNTPDTELVDTQHVDVHKLVRSVSVAGDSLPDFLVCDDDDLYGLPDRIYTSNGEQLAVRRDGTATLSGTLSGGSTSLSVEMTASEGWNYVYLPLPGVSGYEVADIILENHLHLLPCNFWTTGRVFKDAGKPIVEDRLHMLVYFSGTGTKTFTLHLNGTTANGPKVEAFEGIAAGSLEYSARDSLSVVFDRAIDATSFSVADLQLIRQGEYVGDLSGVSIQSADATQRRFTVSGLSAYCSDKGRYELVVQCAGIRSSEGVLGSVGRSVSWMLSSSGVPDSYVVTRVQGLSGNVFTFVFSNPTVVLTADDLTLTRNREPVDLPATVRVVAKGLGVYEVLGIDAALAEEGTYSLSCDLCGGESVTWSTDTTPPEPASNISISPDEGIDDADGITCQRNLDVFCSVMERGLAVEVFCKSADGREVKLADAIHVFQHIKPSVNYGSNAGSVLSENSQVFMASVVLPTDGNQTLIVRTTDSAGNSSDATFDVYVDVIPVTAVFGDAPEENAVAETIGLTFDDDVMEADVSSDKWTLTRDGVSLSLDGAIFYSTDKRHFFVEGLASLCNVDGNYTLSFDSEFVRKRSSGLKTAIHESVSWLFESPDHEPPTLASVSIDGESARAVYTNGISSVVATFSENVNVQELIARGLLAQALKIQLLDAHGNVTGDVSCAAADVTWTGNSLVWAVPSGVVGIGYARVMLDGGLFTDMAGNRLDAEGYESVDGVPFFDFAEDVIATVNAYAMPTWYDFDGNGIGDLIVGEKTSAGDGKIRVYMNRGTTTEPRFSGFSYLQVGGQDLAVTASGCQGAQVSFGDLTGDGIDDLIVGCADGSVRYWAGTVEPGVFADGAVVRSGKEETYGSARAFVCPSDMDGDGCVDLVIGGLDGRFRLLKFGADGSTEESWMTDTAGVPLAVASSRSTPVVADINGDGHVDILSGDTEGNVWAFLGSGEGWNGTAVELFANDAGLADRSRIGCGDVNGDGVSDLLVGRSDGSVGLAHGFATESPVVAFWVRGDELRLDEAVNASGLEFTTEGAVGWEPVWSMEAADGLHCASVAGVPNNTNAWMQTVVDGPGTLAFSWTCSLASRTTKLQLFVDDVAQGVISGATDWTPVRLAVFGEGEHVVRWRLFTGRSGASADDFAAVDGLVWTPSMPPTLEEALNTNLVWRTEGDVLWHGVARGSIIDARDAWASASGLANLETAAVWTKVYGSGVLSFDWAISCEEEYDWMELSVDGNVCTYITGEVGWETAAVEVKGEGWHVIRWEYVKDEEDEEVLVGDNTAWLDSVVWTSSDVADEPDVPEEPVLDPIPDLGDAPSALQVQKALDGSGDGRLAANVTNGVIYNAYREWANKVELSSGGRAGAQAVKDSPNAWLSFALDSATLIETLPRDGDVKIETFEQASISGSYDFSVKVEGLTIGSKAVEENLKTIFGLEGGTSLEDMSSDNVSITFGTPENGRVKFTAGPNAKNADAKAFFMKVKLTP